VVLPQCLLLRVQFAEMQLPWIVEMGPPEHFIVFTS
jgi:hypothetical protein